MQPDFLIEDNFLSHFDSFRSHCDELDYSGMTNEKDGVFYPNVTDEIPVPVKHEIIDKIEALLGKNIKVNAMFLRQSPEGVNVPHPAHTDIAMGRYGFMLYINRLEDCLGGTAFIVHKRTGLYKNPINDLQQKVWDEDHADLDAWQINVMCDMMPNRALLFDANLMHMAMPSGGYGQGNKARLVLTAFLDIEQ